MLKKISLLFIPTLIWGSTWFAIKFQIGLVDPVVSVFYRFSLASLIMLSFCFFSKKKLKFSYKIHFLFFLEGLALFGLNYWLVYTAEQYLTSGLIAVIFSLIVFGNIIFGKIFLKTPINISIILAGILGLIGVSLLFKNEITTLNLKALSLLGFIICLISVSLASLGNIISAFISKKGVPVVQNNTFGMLYGAIAMFLLALASGKTFNFSYSLEYISSLAYLVIFGSIIAFGIYLKTLGEIGADKAAYSLVMVPIVSMLISTYFENYSWTPLAFLGIAFILLGNVFILRKASPQSLNKKD